MSQIRQLDQASTGAIDSGTNVVSEDQNYILPSLEALPNGEVTMQLDSSHQPPLDPPNNGHNVVTSSEERKRKTQREHKGTGVRIEVPLDDILKCTKLKRKGAAKKLRVSVSTLKRVCRGHGIDRWPPRNHNIKKFCSFRPSPVESEGQTRQSLNSDLPSNQALDSVAHTKPAFQDADIVTISSEECKRKTEREDKGTGVKIEVPLEDILKCAKMSRKGAAEKLQVSISTLKRVCRFYGIDRWPPRDIKKFRSFRPSPVENEGQTQQCLNSDLPSNQDSDSVARPKPAFQDADIMTIRAKYENNTIKFRLSLPPELVALQQEVAKRLDLEAGSYYVRYNDEENELILIACDQDLQDCIDTFKSLGNTSVVVLLEPK